MKPIAWLACLGLACVANPAASKTIVGIAIAKSDDRVYTWFDDGMFTIGDSGHLERYRHAFPYAPADDEKPADIVSMSIAKNDHVFTWYRDQTVSEGTSGQLGRPGSRRSVKLPDKKTMSDIVGIGIAGSNDFVYAWYRDGSTSVGTPTDFTAHPAQNGSWQLPLNPSNPNASLTLDDIVEIDVAKNDHVHTWFRNGTHTEGSSGNLAKHGSGPYIRSEFLYHWWGPRHFVPAPGLPNHPAPKPPLSDDARPRIPLHSAAIRPSPHPKAPVTLYEGNAPGKPLTVHQFMKPYDGKDPMVAVGEKFLLFSDSHSLTFADRQTATQLSPRDGLGGELAVPTSMSTAAFFMAFTDAAPENEIDVDRNVGFAKECNGPGIPIPTDKYNDGFCIRDFYDTRVFYDPPSKRFFVVAQARNQLWTDLQDGYSDAPGSCGHYEWYQDVPATGKTAQKFKVPVYDRSTCLFARRLLAVAVSATEDPRDGFHQYMLTEDMDADFPWMAVNGKRVVISHHGPVLEPPRWPVVEPVVQVVDLDGLASGARHPAYFRYYPDDLDGLKAVMPPTHHGPTGGLTFLLASGDQGHNGLDIFGIPDAPGHPWERPQLLKVGTLWNDGPAVMGSVYRAGKLYFASSNVEATKSNGADDECYRLRTVRVTRVPIYQTPNGLMVSTNEADGFLDAYFGTRAKFDASNARISYAEPSIDVDQAGNMLIGYYRLPYEGESLAKEARVSWWPASAVAPVASQLVQGGAPQFECLPTSCPCDGQVDFTTTVVDPVDDASFYTALPFANTQGTMLIAHIQP